MDTEWFNAVNDGTDQMVSMISNFRAKCEAAGYTDRETQELTVAFGNWFFDLLRISEETKLAKIQATRRR